MTSLSASYRACAQITREASSTFSLSAWLFDRDTRRSIQALYAFCRTADNIADSSKLTIRQKQAGLRALRTALTSQQPAKIAADMWPALFHTMKNHNLPVAELDIILDGVSSDIGFRQPLTIGELDRYSFKVAGIVGVLSARILGGYKKSTLEGAKQLGIAMQYTNIIRDVAEDLTIGRIYIPQSSLREAGLTIEDLKAHQNQAGLQRALEILTKRADSYYDHALPAVKELHPSYQKPVLAAAGLYRHILERIKQKQYTVYDSRIRLSRLEKLQLVWRIYHP
ncbi:MAG: phytoene/squalene synthase family protein [bacterium]